MEPINIKELNERIKSERPETVVIVTSHKLETRNLCCISAIVVAKISD